MTKGSDGELELSRQPRACPLPVAQRKLTPKKPEEPSRADSGTSLTTSLGGHLNPQQPTRHLLFEVVPKGHGRQTEFGAPNVANRETVQTTRLNAHRRQAHHHQACRHLLFDTAPKPKGGNWKESSASSTTSRTTRHRTHPQQHYRHLSLNGFPKRGKGIRGSWNCTTTRTMSLSPRFQKPLLQPGISLAERMARTRQRGPARSATGHTTKSTFVATNPGDSYLPSHRPLDRGGPRALRRLGRRAFVLIASRPADNPGFPRHSRSCPTVATNALFSSRAGPPYRHMDLAKARALRFWACLWANSSAHANWDMHGERVDAGTAMVSHKQVGSCLPQCAVTTITAQGLGRLACDY